MAADGWRAFVANAVSGTVSVVEWTGGGFEEDRGIRCRHGAARLRAQRHAALRDQLHRGHSRGRRHHKKKVVDKVKVGGNPYGITVVGNDVFVTQFFARLIDRRTRRGVRRRQGRGGAALPSQQLQPGRDHARAARQFRVHCESGQSLPAVQPDGSRTTPSVRIRMPPTPMTPLLPRPWQECSRTSSNRRSPAMACSICRMSARSPSRPWPRVSTSTPTSRRWCMWSTSPRKPNVEDLTVNLNQQIATEPDPRTRRRGTSPTCSAMTSWRWTRTPTARTSSSSAAAATTCSRRSWTLTASSTSAPRTTSSASRRATSRPASWWTKRASWASSTTR